MATGTLGPHPTAGPVRVALREEVYKNHTVRLNGRVIDIPKRPGAARATYAGKEVVVKHLLSGDYSVFYGEECIAWASGSRPKPSTRSNENNVTDEQLM
jgi:hypothetical protein